MRNEEFRSLANEEEKILKKFMTLEFSGRDELALQLRGIQARSIDSHGSLEFRVINHAPVAIERACVAEGRCPDGDTTKENPAQINVLLHVRNGSLWMLEVYKDDGSVILEPPVADKLDIFSSMPK